MEPQVIWGDLGNTPMHGEYEIESWIVGYPETFRIKGRRGMLYFTTWRAEGRGWRQLGDPCMHKYDFIDRVRADDMARQGDGHGKA